MGEPRPGDVAGVGEALGGAQNARPTCFLRLRLDAADVGDWVGELLRRGREDGGVLDLIDPGARLDVVAELLGALLGRGAGVSEPVEMAPAGRSAGQQPRMQRSVGPTCSCFSIVVAPGPPGAALACCAAAQIGLGATDGAGPCASESRRAKGSSQRQPRCRAGAWSLSPGACRRGCSGPARSRVYYGPTALRLVSIEARSRPGRKVRSDGWLRAARQRRCRG